MTVGVLVAALSVAVLATQGSVVVAYATASGVASAATIVAGLALVAAGLVAWLVRAPGLLGPLAAAAGAAWLAPVWVGWQTGPTFARSVGMVVAPFLVPLLVHLLLAVPAGRISTRAARSAVAAVYATTAMVVVGRALFRDPFLDLHCWNNCTDNAFLVRPVPELAKALDAFGLWFVIGVGAFSAGLATIRLVRATAVGRVDMCALLVPTVFAVAAESAYAGLLLIQPVEDPADPAFQAVFVVRAVTMTGVAAGLAWTVLRDRRRRAAVTRLADELGAAPPLGTLQTVLARSLGDESLRVAYWLADSGRYVDASGIEVELEPTSGQATTAIQRDGELVAVVSHDRALAERRLVDQIGSAARLAVDNERLQAEVLAQLQNLRSSRTRIVETADNARRRLERDLHDGAQQSMIALDYELRLAQASANRNGDKELAELIEGSVAEAMTAVDELRQLAHGIFPAILDEAGLGPALWTLTDKASVPVVVTDVPDERLPGAVERAAYLLVRSVVEAASHQQSSTASQDGLSSSPSGDVTVRITRGSGLLVIDMDGVPDGRYIHLADRVGSVGGELTVSDGRLRAELPCA